MKKKVLKFIALIIAIALIITVCWFANALCGNPISKWLAQKAADAYLDEHYQDTDFYIERLGFSFKFTNYYAHVRSETSIDTQFTLHIDMVGNVYFDTYDDVLSGAITAQRVHQEYRNLVKQAFESPTFKWDFEIPVGHLEIYPREALEDPLVNDIREYALAQEDLIIDHIYDPRELGAKCGYLSVWIESDTVSTELAAEIILQIRKEFDNANIPFRAIDLHLRHPMTEEGKREEGSIWIQDFRYEDIYEEGLADRIQAAHDALEAYFAELDAKNK